VSNLQKQLDDAITEAEAILEFFQAHVDRLKAFRFEASQPVEEIVEEAEVVEPNGSRPDVSWRRAIKTTVSDEERIRNPPVNRMPREESERLFLQQIADGDWHSPSAIAKSLVPEGAPSDEKRYVLNLLKNRAKDLHDAGTLERRSTRQRGSNFEYRLAPGSGPRTGR
jgi:hypothetical protein